MIPLPVPIWAIAAGTAAILAGTGVWRVMDWRCDAARTEAVQRAIEQAAAIAEQDNQVASRFEAARERLRTVYKDREHEITYHVPTLNECRLDDRGLQLANAALVNAPADTAKPDYKLPEPAAAPWWVVR